MAIITHTITNTQTKIFVNYGIKRKSNINLFNCKVSTFYMKW